MTELTERDKELVAIGASIGCNCIPCIAFHVAKAKQVGLNEEQIEAAVALSEQIRSIPASLVVKTARAYLDGESAKEGQSSPGADSGKCRCETSTEESTSGSVGSSRCGC